MGAGPLAYPMRLAGNGDMLTRVAGTSGEVEDAIRILVETRPGERSLFPEFGTPDPMFEGLNSGDVQAALDQFGPPGVQVEDMTEEWADATTQTVSFPFTLMEGVEDIDEDEDPGDGDPVGDED